MPFHFKGMDTLSGQAVLSNLSWLPSGKGSALLGSKFCPFRLCRKANRRSQKLSFLYKMVENLLSVASSLNPCPAEPRCALPLQTV